MVKINWFSTKNSFSSSTFITVEAANRRWLVKTLSLREKCPYSEFFYSIFFSIWTEYGEIRSIKYKPEKQRIRTLFMQCVRHLWWSILRLGPLTIFQKISHRRCSVKTSVNGCFFFQNSSMINAWQGFKCILG